MFLGFETISGLFLVVFMCFWAHVLFCKWAKALEFGRGLSISVGFCLTWIVVCYYISGLILDFIYIFLCGPTNEIFEIFTCWAIEQYILVIFYLFMMVDYVILT